MELLKEKRAALPMPEATPVASQQNVVSLMDALKRSLAAEQTKTPTKQAKPKKAKKAAAGQREMLLPITGKERAKEPPRPSSRQRRAS